MSCVRISWRRGRSRCRVHGRPRAASANLPKSKVAPNAGPNPREDVWGFMSLLNAEPSDPQKSNRNIAVIGSTGRTGRLVLDEGIRRGHSMTAFTRRPDALLGLRGLRSVITGDGRSLEDMRRAVRGQDAIISTVVSEGRGPTSVSLERVQDGPGSNSSRRERSPPRSVPHLACRSRGDSRRPCGGLAARRGGALSERGEITWADERARRASLKET